jgi:hypothetical protein
VYLYSRCDLELVVLYEQQGQECLRWEDMSMYCVVETRGSPLWAVYIFRRYM